MRRDEPPLGAWPVCGWQAALRRVPLPAQGYAKGNYLVAQMVAGV